MGENRVAARKAISWRALAAVVYTVLLFQPAMIWAELVIGPGGALAPGLISVILFVELFRLTGNPLTKQEATILSLTTGLAGMGSFFITRIFSLYWSLSSPVLSSGLAGRIPWYFVPYNSAEVFGLRSFFTSSWLPVFAVWGALFLIGPLFVNLAFGFLTRELYIMNEKLPFPIQQVTASAIVTLTERQTEKMNVFVTGAVIGLIYAGVLYVSPLTLQALGVPVLAGAPIPWVDLSGWAQLAIPGAAFGIGTSITLFASGFVIPFYAIVSMLAGSVFIWMILNPIFIKFNVTALAKEYYYGISVPMLMQRTWLSYLILLTLGGAIALGVVSLIWHRRYLAAAIKSLAGAKMGASITYFLALWLVPVGLSYILVLYLVPEYPIWLMLFSGLAWPLVWSAVNGSTLGVAGVTITPPANLRVLMGMSYMYGTGYPLTSIYKMWFIEPVVGDAGAGWCSDFKVCELTDTNYISFTKIYLVAFPIALLTGLLFTAIFWMLAPMPSAHYPATAIYWPISAAISTIYATGGILYMYAEIWQWALYAFIAISALYVITQLTSLPISVAAFVAGLATIPHMQVTMLIGALTGKFILKKLIFKEKWEEYKPTLAAGIGIGEAMMLLICAALGLLIKSLYYLPY